MVRRRTVEDRDREVAPGDPISLIIIIMNSEYKTVLFGDSSVGKSCILNRFVSNEFSDQMAPTIGS